jgi:membrane-associated phospholipid phosphatase
LVLPLLFYSSFKHRGHTAVKVLLSIIAVSVCLSRIALGAHYPSDILVGIGLVFGVLPLVLFPVNKMLRKNNEYNGQFGRLDTPATLVDKSGFAIHVLSIISVPFIFELSAT